MLNASQNEAVHPDTIESDAADGVYLDDLPEGVVLEVETRGHRYTIVNRTHGEALISGHPTFCPKPITVRIEGSTWGGSILKSGFIGLGMHLTLSTPNTSHDQNFAVPHIRTRQPLGR